MHSSGLHMTRADAETALLTHARDIRARARTVAIQCGRADLCDDAAQEAMLDCWRRITNYDPERGPLRSYLRVWARWSALRVCRVASSAFTIPERMWKGQRDGEPLPIYQLGTGDTDYDTDYIATMTGATADSVTSPVIYDDLLAQAELNARDRAVVESCMDGVRPIDLAAEWGVSRQNISKRWRRSAARLRAVAGE